MIVVTDRGADLSPQQMAGLDIHFTPLTITLDGRSYISGVDIQESAPRSAFLSATRAGIVVMSVRSGTPPTAWDCTSAAP